jgi:hypothetical protein
VPIFEQLEEAILVFYMMLREVFVAEQKPVSIPVSY